MHREAILPQPKQTHPRNRGNYLGHTLHRRGNIELDVTVAQATHRVLVRGFEHAYVAFMSVPPVFTRLFSQETRYRGRLVITSCPDGAS